MTRYKGIDSNLLICVLCPIMIGFLACQKDYNQKATRPKPEKILSAIIQENPATTGTRIKSIHLYADTVYILSTDFTREAGEQLIIDPGTLVKAAPGTGISIQSGGIIVANGENANPIVFTSNLPTGSANNYWKGLSIYGKSFNNDISVTGDETDASGSLRYVRIEFAGLTLNSVGSGTLIDHVQCSYSHFSPAFQIEGGSVDGKYLFSYACGAGADFYLSNGYRGKLQFLLAIRHPFFGALSSRPQNSIAGLYIENNSALPLTAKPFTFPLISNMTVVGPNGQNGSPAIYSDTLLAPLNAAFVSHNNAGFRIRNSVFVGYPLAGWQIGDSATARSVHYLKSEFTYSVVHCNKVLKPFYIKPGVYKPYDSSDFKSFMEEARFHNNNYSNLSEVGLTSPLQYNYTGAVPAAGSALLNGADFTDAPPFFDRVSFKGALGDYNWLLGWVNFNPLKTEYNIPR